MGQIDCLRRKVQVEWVRRLQIIILRACCSVVVRGQGGLLPCRGDHERRYGCQKYVLTPIDRASREHSLEWEADVPCLQPLSAQKGHGVARFVHADGVPGMRLMMIGGKLQ